MIFNKKKTKAIFLYFILNVNKLFKMQIEYDIIKKFIKNSSFVQLY